MIEKTFIITNKLGIHARPALDLVNVVNKTESKIKVNAGDKTIDMKSIMGLMSLGLYLDQKFIITIEGKDEKEAMEKLTKYFLEKGLAKVNE